MAAWKTPPIRMFTKFAVTGTRCARGLVDETRDTGCGIDHRLLADRDEAGARPVEVLDEQDDGAQQHASDVDGQPGTPRLDPAGITGKAAGDGGKAVERDQDDVWHPVRAAVRRFSWSSINSLSVWMKSPVGTIPVSFLATAFTCCHSASWISFERTIAAFIVSRDRGRSVMSMRIFTYSCSSFSASARWGGGSRRARSAVVPIAFASFNTASRRPSKRDSAMAKVNPIMSASSARIALSRVAMFLPLRPMERTPSRRPISLQPRITATLTRKIVSRL